MNNTERLLNALRESELLRELAELLASSLDPIHTLQMLVRRTTEACEVERCAVWLLNDTGTHFLPSAYHLSAPHLKQKDVQAADARWRHSKLELHHPLLHRLLKGHGMLIFDDLRTEPSLQTLAESFLVHSILLIALIREGRPVGIMSLDNPGKPSTFSAEQQQLARAIGQQAAVAIDNARLYQQAQMERQRAERLTQQAQSIHKVAMAVNAGESLKTVLEIALHHLLQSLNAKGACVALLEAENLSILCTTKMRYKSKSGPLIAGLGELPHCHSAAIQGTMIFVSKEQTQETERLWFNRLGLEHAFIIPLMVGALSRRGKIATRETTHDKSHCVGFAFVNYSHASHRPGQDQLAFARDIATQCALAVEKAHILAEVHQSAALATERANTLDAVFNAMTEGIIVLDLDGQVIINNSTATHFLGMPLHAKADFPSLLANTTVYSLNEQPIPASYFPLSRALTGEHIRGERFITRRTDGSERIVEVNTAPLFNSEAYQIGIVSALRDVTEQVRVEQRVRRALDTMLHAAEAVSGIADIKEILRRVLAMTLNALNCERGAVQLYDQQTKTFTPLLSLGFSADEEAQWLDEQGAWLQPTEHTFSGFAEQLMEGHATLVCAEQYPEQPNPFLDIMVLAVPITYNQRMLGVMMLDRSYKRQSTEPLLSTTITRSLRRYTFNLWDMAVAEGIAQFAGLAIEQTHWQQEAEIARTNEASMRESNALKDEFLAITAHEFRTPLTIILAHNQMIARVLRRIEKGEQGLAENKEKLQESISTIDKQTHQLTNIVNTFLEVTLLNRGQINLYLKEVNLEEIVKQTIASQQAAVTGHPIFCSILPYPQPYLLLGDQARLQQILTNLLQNAIKYSPSGSPITVTLSQKKKADEKPIIEVCIEDQGIGVPLDAQPHLFERFYRAPNSEGSRTRGIGLGLYVVSQFLRLHRGTIRVESSGIPGEGSRFLFTLPLLEKDHTTDV